MSANKNCPPSPTSQARGGQSFPICVLVGALAAWLASGSATALADQATIHQDVEHRQVTLADGQGQLSLRLNYDGCCVLDRVTVRGREVAAEFGVTSGIRQDGQWLSLIHI